MMARRATWAAATMLCGGLLATQAPAQSNDSARVNAIAACSTIEKKSARLACYDAQAQGLPAAPRVSVPKGFDAPAPVQSAVAPAAPAAVEPPPAPSFGAVKKPKKKTKVERARDSNTNQMIAHATNATDNGIGHWTVTLDNGQAWRMTESSPNYAPPRSGDDVRIRKGALGGYLMDVNHQVAVSVERIQ